MAEETEAHLTTASCQVLVESDEVPLSLLQAKQAQLPQLFLIRSGF